MRFHFVGNVGCGHDDTLNTHDFVQYHYDNLNDEAKYKCSKCSFKIRGSLHYNEFWTDNLRIDITAILVELTCNEIVLKEIL
jgi:hypothetical protein